MKCGVIICTRNRNIKLKRLLESINNQSTRVDEIIIVDSSVLGDSEKKTVLEDFKQWVAEENSVCKYIFSEPGLTKQRNIGVRSATSDILFFLDDDLILDKRFIESIRNVFLTNSEFSGGMGTITNTPELNGKRKLIRRFQQFFLISSAYGNGKFHLSGLPQNPIGTSTFKQVEVLSGGLTAYRRSIFKELSFDEELTGYCYLEDVDFSRRASFKWKLFYEPKAKVHHDHISDDRGSRYELKKMYIQNYRYIFNKNNAEKSTIRYLAHGWAILGIALEELIFGSKEGLKGIIDGIKGV